MADPGGKYTAFGVGYAEEKSTSPSLDADGEFLLRLLRKERITDQILFENNQLEYENSSETVSLSEGLNFSDPAVAALGPSHPLPSHSHSWVPVRTSSNPSNPNNTSNQTHLQGPVKEEFEKPFFLFQHHSANGVVPSQVSMPLAFQPPVNMGIDSQMGPWISPVFPNYVPNFNFGSFPEPVGHALPNDKSGSPFGSLGYPQQVAKFDSIGVPYQDNCGIRPNGMQNTSYRENNGQVESRYANVPASGSASTVPCHRENRRKERQGKGAWKGNVDDKNEVKGTVRLLRRSTSQQQGGNVESFKHRVDNSESQLGPTNLRNSQVYVPVNLSKSQHEHDSRQKLGRFKDDGSGSHLLLTNELQALRLNNMENDFSYSGTSSNNSQYSTVSSSPLQIRKNSRLRPSIPLEVNQFERNKHNRKVRGFVERRRQGHQRDELSGNNPQASNEDRDNSPDNQLFHTDLGHSHARSTEESDSEAAEELALNQSQNTQNEDQIHKLQVRRVRMKEFQSFMGQNPHQILKEMKFVEFKYRDDLEVFTSRFLSIYESLIPATDEEEKRKQLLFCLEKVIHRVWPGSQLHLFGSCANAFGVSKSDIDICLSINEEEINKPKLVAELAEILKAEGMQNVQALTRARVPIVKLTDPLTGISCDICINNILAVENTKLLHDYAQIDIRLQQLAFVVKHWAKCRQVNETYQGTLSSYGYVLMCIHFLQQRKPAILPCLQRMKATYHVTVGGVECSYYDQVENLKSFGAQNSETLGQLLSAFFDYWAFRHDYANSVISVRTGGTISKRIKKWTRRIGNERHLICIEDPFETDHDLGRVVDKYSIRVLKDEFQRAAIIMQHDADPSVTLFKPCTSRC